MRRARIAAETRAEFGTNLSVAASRFVPSRVGANSNKLDFTVVSLRVRPKYGQPSAPAIGVYDVPVGRLLFVCNLKFINR
jgi:hypothetical protein